MLNLLITLSEIYPNQSDRTNDIIERELNGAQHRSLFPRDNKPVSFSDMLYDSEGSRDYMYGILKKHNC